MMVLMSNDLLPDETVKRSLNQNGSCSSNGASVLPLKWKPRHISAVRDFPRGCGPIVQPVNVSQEGNPSPSLVNNTNQANDSRITGTQVESLPNGVSKSTEDGKVGLIMESNKELKKEDIQIETILNNTTRKMKFPQRRVSAVRDFPPYCGLNATEPIKEERIRINGKRKNAELTVAVEESITSLKNESPMENQGDEKSSMEDKSHTASQIIEKVCQELVVYKRDNDKKKRISIDISDNDDDDSEGNLQEENNIKNISIENKKVNNEKKPKKKSLDEINNPIYIKGDWFIVLGLQAPLLCPQPTPSIPFKKSKSKSKSKSKKVKLSQESNSNTDKTHSCTLDMVVSNEPTPKESKSNKVKVPKESTSNVNETTTDKVVSNEKTPKNSKSKTVKAPKESTSNVNETDTGTTDKVVSNEKTPKNSKSKKVKAPKESISNVNETDTGTSDMVMSNGTSDMVVSNEQTPKKSKSKKVKVPKESNSNVDETNTSTIDTQTPKKSKKKKVKVPKDSKSKEKVPYMGTLDIVAKNEEKIDDEETEEQEEEIPDSNSNSNSHRGVDVTLPPFGPRNSDSARNRIRETLRFFHALCRKLLQGEEAKVSEDDDDKHVLTGKRVDLTARALLQKKGKAPDRGKKDSGSIPGVEVGDEFQYRAELALVGLHWVLQGGIDYIKIGKKKTPVAVSIVASGGYDNEVNKPECLIYSGSGGIGKDKEVQDQKLERGNVALKNSIDSRTPVRVIRGYKSKSTEPSSKSLTTTYIYDGLYTVERYWQEKGPHGNLVFKFELKRIPGQPELALREVKSKKFKTREGIVVDDITNGKEKIRISAVNTIDNEKPPAFNYISKIAYPDEKSEPPAGCDCVGRCSGKKCKCALKNGGEIPYNHNGAIVEVKSLVYECGPTCKCGPNCYNRVTQNGMKIQLELFKTETRGWGVRSLTSISSGTFICEYVGELLEDVEAEKRTGNDEYLFDIGQNYSDTGMGVGMGKDNTGGYTIDAAEYGNVGRFINHSCSPNLYAQNVLYDREDKRMPHIMLFAAENIPPLTELTYHYNYAVDTVHDKDGNIKVKKCFCGSPECTGRLY